MDITIQFVVLIPVVLGLVQVGKIAGLNTRWSPLLSVVLGIIGAFVIQWSLSNAGIAIIQGIIAGLSAAGLWSGTRATLASGSAVNQ